MPYEIDETHDPSLESWVESANDPETDFPIQNLPFCVIRTLKGRYLCVRIGDRFLDVHAACKYLPQHAKNTTKQVGLANVLVSSSTDSLTSAIARGEWEHFSSIATLADRAWLRRGLSALLRSGHDELGTNRKKQDRLLIPIGEIDELDPADLSKIPTPFAPADYTDFYASVHHATNVGSMFRPDNPLLPNYKHIPIGYHGRASSIVPSGTEITRPRGQLLPGATITDGDPEYGPCKLLDYELEVGFVVGRGNELGETIPIAEAEDHILGLCLVNDWSARDMQKWEYQPLGPFLAKSFATTVSPYIVTMEALAPFRSPAFERPAGDPKPQAYLHDKRDQAQGAIDITLEVYLSSAEMRKKNLDPVRLSRGGFKDMYWTIAQMLTHHASNGCNMQPGDLLASGTVSGTTRGSRGCLLELTWDGDPFADPPKVVPGTQRTPIELPTGETRKFLADGDEVVIKGYCEREGFRRIGFGECRGVIKPARG